MRKKKLGEILIESELITEEQLENALTIQQGKNKKLGKVLIELGYVDEMQVAETLTKQLKLQMVNCNDYSPPKEVLALVSKTTAEQRLVLPLELNGKYLTIVMANPLDWETIEDLSFETGLKISVAIAPESNILAAIEHYYGAEDETWEILSDLPSYDDVEFVKEETEEDTESVNLQSLYQNSEAAPIVKLVTMVIADSIKCGASDIHIEPREKNLQVRYRIDGALKNIQTYPKQIQDAVISRVKIISNLDITNRRFPQDGRSALRLENKNVDLRVSTLPSVYGEKIVIRLLDASTGLIPLSQLGISDNILKPLIEIFSQPQGMLLVTGPTGSGKTTSLYSILQQLRTETKNIITLEDPVEYKLAEITQVGMNEGIGFTFASALRSVLRQDPDIVMLGEIRDLDTAEIATRAALTGHFVLSTLHTNDTVSTISRLIDIGLAPFLVTSAVSGIIAQRLVRRICTECKTEIEFPEEAKKFDLPVIEHFYKGQGCNKCNNTGYKGRVGVYELLIMESNLKRLISGNFNEDDIWDVARNSGSKTMFQDAWDKVSEGLTTLDEIISKIPFPRFILAQENQSTQENQSNSTVPQTEDNKYISISPQKVLIFDNDAEEINIMRSALETDGYEVIHSTNEEMLQITEESNPGLIIINDSQDKLDMIKEIRNNANLASTPVLCVSDQQVGDREDGIENLGINDFLPRPVDTSQLLDSIKRVMKS
jgi:type IV pilus assembly protein PilB